jgi:hypothetical protein
VSFTLGRCPPVVGDTGLFGALQIVDTFLERPSLRSRSKISGAYGDEGPVDCWLGAIGGVPEAFEATTFYLAVKSRLGNGQGQTL